MSKHILAVDDDVLLRRSLAYNLEKAGYKVSTAGNAEDALAQIKIDPPDLVILDIGLPGMDGMDALRKLRQQMEVPVIFLTARRRELDEVVGLELGADDYITKPFDIDILLARIKAVLRRMGSKTEIDSPALIDLGDLIIDQAAHTVTLNGKVVELAPREFDLLTALAQEAGHVLSVDDLLARVWGAEYIGEPQVVYVHIRWLREKLEQNPPKPKRIITVRGVGYKLVKQ
jgi:DNA-binding response OmpR family regulator